MTTAEERRRLYGSAHVAAASRGGVLSRAELRALGIDRRRVARQVAAGRWRLHGRRTVAVHTAPLDAGALRWRAVWEGGVGAALDGVSALLAAGMQGFTAELVDISVPPGRQALRVPGVRVHHLRRSGGTDVVTMGVPRVRPALAAVRAAHWAASDRQAALILCLAVQQRLVLGRHLLELVDPVPGRSRRAFVAQVVADIADGAHALGELDFARLCRLRGLPQPSRQVVRHGPRGRIYLDVRWDDIGLVVEIDGAQHRQGLAVSEDNLRRNALAISGEIVLTIDLVGLRLRTSEFMGQVAEAHHWLSRPSRRSA